MNITDSNQDLEFLANLFTVWNEKDFDDAIGSAAVGVAAGLWKAHALKDVDDPEARADALLILVQRAAHLSTVDIHKLSEGIPGRAGFGRCYTRSRQSEKQMLRDVQSCLNAEPGEREIYAETVIPAAKHLRHIINEAEQAVAPTTDDPKKVSV